VNVVKASESARRLGRRGGRARAARLSSAEKRRIASLGGAARRESLLAEKRILRNLRYAALIGELRGRRPPKRSSRCSGRLPGIYADET
jgi:hypothetical protein